MEIDTSAILVAPVTVIFCTTVATLVPPAATAYVGTPRIGVASTQLVGTTLGSVVIDHYD